MREMPTDARAVVLRLLTAPKSQSSRKPCGTWHRLGLSSSLPFRVKGGKTLSEYIFSELPQIADINGRDGIHSTA